VAKGSKSAVTSLLHLAKVLLPLAVAMGLLDWLGVLAFLDGNLSPLTSWLGLPGSAILAVAAAMLMDVYTAIAVAVFLGMDLRAATILAAFCLTSHNLVTETAAMRRSGSSGTKMVLLRLACALGMGWLYSLILPRGLSSWAFSAPLGLAGFQLSGAIAAWALRSGVIGLKIALVVLAVGAFKLVIQEFKGMEILARILAPFMKFLGLPAAFAPYWVAANAAGYAYSAGLVSGDIVSGRIKRQEGDLFNHGAALCHALVEDTALFMVVGLSLFWLVVPRLALATAITWVERIRRHYFRRSFRAGVA
jgi:spore maturation protein SpmB